MNLDGDSAGVNTDELQKMKELVLVAGDVAAVPRVIA
jgi:hypothetical protein